MRTRHTFNTFGLTQLARATALAGVLLSTACDSTSASAPTAAFLLKANLTNLAVAGNTSLQYIGQTSAMTAQATGPDGRLALTNTVTWASADAAVATVSPSGVVTATGFGAATITARLNESTATRPVNVVAATALTIAGSGPDGNTLHSGILSLIAVDKTAQLTLTGTWPGGLTRNVTGEAIWRSLNPAIASISPSGVLRSIGLGETTVVATYQLLTLATQVVVAPVVTSLSLRGNNYLTSLGDPKVFTVVARFSNSSTRDVSAEATWTTSDPSVMTVSPTGTVTAVGFGRASLGVTYLNQKTGMDIFVSPPGTFVIYGRVYDPGDDDRLYSSGLQGVAVRDLQTGASTTTDAKGDYMLAGVVNGDRVRFEKDGWEAVEHVMTEDDAQGAPLLHPISRIAAGATTVLTIEPTDVQYDLTSGVSCYPCRLIRVVSATPGTLHLQLRWTQASSGRPSAKLSLFVNGQTFNASATSPIETVADVTVAAGETLVYTGVIGDSPNFATMQLTLATSLVALPDASNNRPPQKEQ